LVLSAGVINQTPASRGHEKSWPSWRNTAPSHSDPRAGMPGSAGPSETRGSKAWVTGTGGVTVQEVGRSVPQAEESTPSGLREGGRQGEELSPSVCPQGFQGQFTTSGVTRVHLGPLPGRAASGQLEQPMGTRHWLCNHRHLPTQPAAPASYPPFSQVIQGHFLWAALPDSAHGALLGSSALSYSSLSTFAPNCKESHSSQPMCETPKVHSSSQP
jgi:hypothetical protein